MRYTLAIRYAAAVPLACVLAAGGSSAACFEVSTPGATAAGVVSVVKRKHPNGTPLSGYVITLAAPVCLNDPDALDDVSRVRRIHVVPATPQDASVLQRRVGKRVVATGSAISAHTSYHFEPIVFLDSQVRDAAKP